QGLADLREAIRAGGHRLYVADELCTAVSRDLLSEADVLDCLATAPADCCVVLTGRGATSGLLKRADTVTRMECVKHALTAGVQAQKGVEL
ncbi:MAG: cob(I)yrinic acid a,c-diamide adenosyltransferase, partial [Planctomycetota bacterium]